VRLAAASRIVFVLGCLAIPVVAQVPASPPGVAGALGLTGIAGIKVGHSTLAERPTGCTVVLAEAGAVAGVDVRGAAPGTRETDLLNPVNLVDRVQAIVFAGGSAFGLDAASGVVRYLDERKVGFPTPYGPVPIVPAAILFDLGVGSNPAIRPGADCGYRAATAASTGAVEEGSVGAGAGATVGKIKGIEFAMKGGVGTSAITLPGGLIVAALVVVNAFGDVVDPANGRVVAGARTPDGKGLADARILVRSGALLAGSVGQNTTIGVVATNARLTKTEATRVAQMAHDGLARSISPAHTQFDGDTLFVLSTGTRSEPAELTAIGALAAEAVADAVIRAVRTAKGLPGLPSVRDLAGVPR
jgi:L-aminopeptidase/D-esterase-like protein